MPWFSTVRVNRLTGSPEDPVSTYLAFVLTPISHICITPGQATLSHFLKELLRSTFPTTARYWTASLPGGVGHQAIFHTDKPVNNKGKSETRKAFFKKISCLPSVYMEAEI